VSFAQALYQAVLTLARATAPVAATLSRKGAAGLAGRSASAGTFAAWARGHRDQARPLVVFHGASAGELRQAEPVVRRIRHRHPEWQLAATCFSPSGLAVATKLPVDVAGLLPFDLQAEITPLLEALAPAAIVVTKLDLWPNLTRLAKARGTRLALIAATVRRGSGRLRWPARQILAPAYAALDAVGAAAEEDVSRLVALGARPAVIRVLGDPRYDGVLERIKDSPKPLRHEATLIAGSTSSEDDRLLLEVFARIRTASGDPRLVIAPHEPADDTMARIGAAARRHGLPPPRPYDGAAGTEPLLVMREVGPLAFLYAEGAIAYVGGGFAPGGLHSVLEPAAWGMPIVAGPDAGSNPDATRLRGAGALVCLPSHGAEAALEDCWRTWLTDSTRRAEAGRAARRVVETHAGAADRAVELIEELVRATSRR
jgi:3-deoxy-D-manno-octulosonic-acid transferase